MSKTILVTGPTGKVGRRLIPLLAAPGGDRPCRQSVARHGQEGGVKGYRVRLRVVEE